MPTLDQILEDEEFKSQGLDDRLGTIDQYWEKIIRLESVKEAMFGLVRDSFFFTFYNLFL